MMAARADALRRADVLVAVGAVVVAGWGAGLALAGAGASSAPLAVVGGALVAAGLLLVVAAGWLDGTVLLALSLPLPAAYASETLRISAALLVTTVVVPAWLLRRTVEGRALEFGALPRRATALLGAAVLLAAVFAQVWLPALREVITFALLFGVLLMAADEVAARPDKARSIAIALGAAAAPAGLAAALEAVDVLPGRFTWPGSAFYRAALGFSGPTELGVYFALSLPFVVYMRTIARGGLRRMLGTAAVACCVLGLAATFSRGSWVSVLAATATLGLVAGPRLMLRVWTAALVAVVAIDLASGGALRTRVARTLVDDIVIQRFALQYTGLLIFREYPVTGIGPGGFGEGLERFGPQVTGLWDYAAAAHNVYIHMAAEAGAIGLAALLIFFGATLFVLVRGARRARAAAAAGALSADQAALHRTLAWAFGTACVAGMFEWVFAHGLGQIIMLAAGMGCGLAAGTPGGDAGAPGAPAVRAPAPVSAAPGPAARA
jgi:O-antigen ligase